MTDSARRAAAAAQLVEHVDTDGTVLAVVSRAEMRARALRHRSVYIAVLDGNQRILVHKRAPWKDVFAGAWDLAFGGVCDVDEPWPVSAARELAEEAGVVAELRDHGPVHFEAPGVALLGRLYSCVHNGPFSFDDGEVTDARWVPLSEIEDFVNANVVPPDSAQIVTRTSLTRTGSSSSHTPDSDSGAQLESRERQQPLQEPNLITDLTAATVRPSGRDGVAARTAAGFIALGSADAAPLMAWIEENQHSSDLIEGLAAEITTAQPAAFSMLFTAGGAPWLVAWGGASTLIDGASARFVISPTDGKLLVHELGLSDDNSRIVMSTGPIGEEVPTSPIELAEGSMNADLVSITLAADLDDGSLVVPLVAARANADDDDLSSEFGAGSDQDVELAAVTPVEDLTEPGGLVDTADAQIDPETEMPTSTVDSVADEPDLPLDEPEPQIVIGNEGPKGPEDPLDIPVAAGAPFASPSVPPEFAPPVQSSPFSALLDSPGEESEPETPAQPPALDLTPTKAGPVMVLGVACPQGHHNHPDAVYCSQCGTKMGVHQTTVLVNGIRPPLGVLVVDDGTTFSIDQDLIIGRDAPSHADVRAGTASPMMLSDESLALSRHHARIRLDSWSVFATDLNSSNGTWFSRGATGSWNRVSPDQSIALEAGDRLRVGGRVVQVELHHVR